MQTARSEPSVALPRAGIADQFRAILFLGFPESSSQFSQKKTW
jgi:hypothetical protein